jgi:multiple sugar transport system substrate-binding protein
VNPQYNNQRLGFPEYRSLEVLYYNVDALKKLNATVPKTWDDFKTLACNYYKATGNVAYEVRTDASWVAGAAFAQGGDIYDYKNNKFTYNTPEAQVGPQAMQDLMKQGCVGLIADPNNFSDENDFGAGKTLFYGGSTSGLNFVIGAVKTAKQNFAVDIAPLPYKGQPVSDIYGASWSIFGSGNKAQDLADWLFMRWFSEPEQQAPWAIASGYFPVRLSTKTVPVMADYLTKNPAYSDGLALLANTKAEPPIAGYDPVRTLAGNAMNDILDGKNVKTTFTTLNDKSNSILGSFKPNLTPATPAPTKAATAAPTAAATTAATKSS